jgi:hypothetical protein
MIFISVRVHANAAPPREGGARVNHNTGPKRSHRIPRRRDVRFGWCGLEDAGSRRAGARYRPRA